MTGPNPKPNRTRQTLWFALRHGKWVLFIAFLCPLFLGLYALYVYKRNNFHILSPGKAYRSAQLDKKALKDCIHEFGIKTILNLRESGTNANWYQEEKMVAADHGVQHLDFNLSEYDEVSVEDLDKIAVLLRDAPKPILIHCAAGADRTGLVSALYRYKLDGLAPEKSFGELSRWNGHVPLLRNRVLAMDNSFWRYVSNDLKKASELASKQIVVSVLPSAK